jgi:hypothetical protein
MPGRFTEPTGILHNVRATVLTHTYPLRAPPPGGLSECGSVCTTVVSEQTSGEIYFSEEG